jgi:glycyl-tRNA synthetase beta chain
MARKLPFLLEIGTEEIPDWMIEPALDQMRSLVEELLAASRLGGKVTSVDATPRRLVLTAGKIVERQPDTEELVSGPPRSAGEGAAKGFARKMGVDMTQLEVTRTPKGEYYAFRKKVAGRTASQILAEALPGLVLKISWPKTMYWTGKGGPRFIRPIRWMVALLGQDVVPFELAGVRSGNVSRGHRLLGKPAIQVTVKNYAGKLRQNGVIVSAAERRQMIESASSLLTGGLRIKPDPALLNTLVYLTEYPTPIAGSFDGSYLSLPAEVLVTVMRHHQKYFSVETEDGRLAPCFVAVMNTDRDPEGRVRAGNERVLRARFNDARFFWDVDQRRKLAERVEGLAHVTFQARLGSYKEKTGRVVALAGELGGDEAAVRAATLAKTDLTTEMVKEFTELQGVVGGLYARAQGEPEEVALAIYDHYKPLSMEDSIPRTKAGQIVSLADKVDTLRGCFGIGLVPSGSRDPFALRRAAQGVVKILVEGRHSIPLAKLAGGDAQLREFLLDRIRYYFREIRGFQYDEVNAVLAAGCEDLVDVERRLAAIQAVRPTENFEPLAASFKRIQNILKQAGFTGGGALDGSLLEAGPEAGLHDEFQRVKAAVASPGDYRGALEAIASLRPKVDLFFDKVLVNAPDEAIRQNRLALLHSLLTEFSAIADFSEIVTEPRP